MAEGTVRVWSSVSEEKEAGQQVRLQPWTSGGLISSGIFLQESYRIDQCAAGRGPKLVDIQGSLPAGSRAMHPDQTTGQETWWMTMELLSLRKHKQKTQRRWKQGQTT